MNPKPPKIEPTCEIKELDHHFGNQYHYFHEDIDLRFPDPIMTKLDINIFCDSDHGHDCVSRRSITGILALWVAL